MERHSERGVLFGSEASLGPIIEELPSRIGVVQTGRTGRCTLAGESGDGSYTSSAPPGDVLFNNIDEEVSAKEKEAAVRAELEAKDLLAVAGSMPVTRSTSKAYTNMYAHRAQLQESVLKIRARVKSALEEFEAKKISILNPWEACKSD